MEKYQTDFTSPDGIQTIIAMLEKWDIQRFYAAFALKKRRKIDNVTTLDGMVMEASGILKQELVKLDKFSENFNQQFVTQNNKFFDSSFQLLNKIKSSASRFKTCFKELTPNHTTGSISNVPTNKPLLYNRSPLGTEEYSPIMFTDLYPQEVHNLCQHMQEFFQYIEDGLRICQEVLDEEAEIREDPDHCQDLWLQFKADLANRLSRIVKTININTPIYDSNNSPAINMRNRSASEKDFAQKGYHNLEYADAHTLGVKELVEEAQNDGLTKEEVALFPNDRELALKVRFFILHIDDYLPQNYHGKTIPAKFIACLMQLCKPTVDKHFVDYLTQTYKQAGGTLEVTKNSSANGKKHKERKKDPDFDQIYAAWDSYEGD